MPTIKTTFVNGEGFTPGTTTSTDGINGMNTLLNSIATRYFGDGSDGAFSESSGTTNLIGSQVYQYTSFLLDTNATLSKTADDGKPLIIKVQGNCTINGTIDLSGKGFAGGEAESVQGLGFITTDTGGNGTYSAGMAGGPGTGTGGGAGGAGCGGNGTDGGGTVGGTRGMIGGYIENLRSYNVFSIMCGAGGGTGASGGSSTYYAGNGGGAILIIVGGTLTFGASSSIDVSGLDGQGNGSNQGGGGGGGGMIKILSVGAITDNGVSTDITGGSGGDGSSGDNGGVGGVGLEIIEQF